MPWSRHVQVWNVVRFASSGKAYIFGSSLPLALLSLHLRGLCIVSNLDGWLLCAETRADALRCICYFRASLGHYIGFLLHFQLRKVLSGSPVDLFPLFDLYLESQAMRSHLWGRASLSFRENYAFNSNPKGSGPYSCSFCLLDYKHEAFTGSRAKSKLWVSFIMLETNKFIRKSFIRAFKQDM